MHDKNPQLPPSNSFFLFDQRNTVAATIECLLVFERGKTCVCFVTFVFCTTEWVEQVNKRFFICDCRGSGMHKRKFLKTHNCD